MVRSHPSLKAMTAEYEATLMGRDCSCVCGVATREREDNKEDIIVSCIDIMKYESLVF